MNSKQLQRWSTRHEPDSVVVERVMRSLAQPLADAHATLGPPTVARLSVLDQLIDHGTVDAEDTIAIGAYYGEALLSDVKGARWIWAPPDPFSKPGDPAILYGEFLANPVQVARDRMSNKIADLNEAAVFTVHGMMNSVRAVVESGGAASYRVPTQMDLILANVRHRHRLHRMREGKAFLDR